PSIPDPTITVNPAPLNNEPPFSYYPAVSNAEPYPSVLIPPIHLAPHFPTGGVSLAMGGESKTRENKKLSALEERLRAIEGLNMYGSVNVASLRLVPDVVVPPKFKIPDFDKYTGNSDPRIHLATYIAKMRDLQNLVQRDRESFKEYAQRWREKAAEIYPPVIDNELCSLFIETLKAPYFSLMIGNTSNNFANIIQTGERIEANLRLGEITGSGKRKFSEKYDKF
ncbi:hypothetical protein P3X46_000761, partial [Hevea brasiliensis]